MWSEQFKDIDTDALQDSVIPQNEEFTRGWYVIFINEYIQEQERMLLLTNEAYYRVKYSISSKKVQRCARIPLKDIIHIQKGLLINEGSKNPPHYGFRITHKASNSTPLTFRPFDNDPDSEKAVVDGIVNNISRLRKAFSDEDIIEEVPRITLAVPVPVLSTVHNLLGLGRPMMRSSLKSSGDLQKVTSSPPLASSTSSLSNYQSFLHEEEDLSPPEPISNIISSPLPPTRTSNYIGSVPSSPAKSTTALGSSPSSSSSPTVTPIHPPVSQNTSSSLSASSSSVSSSQEEEQSLIAQSIDESLLSASASHSEIENRELYPDGKPPDEDARRVSLSSAYIQLIKHFFAQKIQYGSARWVENSFAFIDEFGYLSIFILLAFALGYLNWSFLWIVFILVFIFKMHDIQYHKLHKTKEAVWAKAFAEMKRTENKRTENCAWFNAMFTELWPNMSKNLSATATAKFEALLQEVLQQKKPAVVHAAHVLKINFDAVPPVFKNVTGLKPSNADYQCDVDVFYSGNAQVQVELAFGVDEVHAAIPLTISNIVIKGRMRFVFTFFAKSPFLHTLSWCFVDDPFIDASVEAFHTFDLRQVPYLSEWIEESVKEVIKSTLVAPELVTVSYQSIFGTTVTDSLAPAALAFTNDVKQEDMNRHQTAIERSRKEGEFAGLLHVKIIEARKLLSEYMPASADEVFTTRSVNRSKNPVWNEFFELLVKKNDEKIVKVDLMARDTVNGKDHFLGMGELGFADLGSDTKDIWVSLERPSKKGNERSGEVHLQLRFVKEETHTINN